jgi:8-oxo-dGTP pyrophosphatase MutT (NUDIX family)
MRTTTLKRRDRRADPRGMGRDRCTAQTTHVVRARCRDADAVLLLRRRRGDSLAGHWELPGGKVDAGESHVEALRREMWEETGLTWIGEPALAAGPVERVSPRGTPIVEWVYDVAVTGRPALSDEHDAGRWHAAAPLGERLTESAADALRAA